MSDDPFVNAATIPELAVILSRRLTARVRLFEAWCPAGDRLLQVLRVRGRPLAIARTVNRVSEMWAGAPERNRTRVEARGAVVAMWLDLAPETYYLPHDPPVLGGPSIDLHPYRLPSQCRHERVSVPGIWLCEQVGAGIRKRIIDDATRFEMGARFRGE